MEMTRVVPKTKWSIDLAHSDISFKVRHLMIAHVKGVFKTFDACIYTDGNDFTTAEVDLWIDASSVSTGDDNRDTHLKSADFFDVEKHKQITFASSTMGSKYGEDNHELWGELTMMGITKNIKLNVDYGGIMKDPWGMEKAGFTVTGKINRNDWGLVWNAALEAGGIMVSDEVSIICEIELTNIGQKDLKMELEDTTPQRIVL
jgi:polyisoprenoid-binding protein YceI